tara:strand:+ start:84 stop:542 length:459 start_codon:yes stop_codon:yes gene_type:complete
MRQVYDIVDKLKDRLRTNPNVFTVTYGDLSEVDLNKTTIFPLSHLNITNVVFDGPVINFTIQLLALDVVDYNKDSPTKDVINGNDNLQDVYNSQLQVVNDVIEQLRRGDLFTQKLQLLDAPSATPFKDRFENELAGWGVNIIISMPNEISIC